MWYFGRAIQCTHKYRGHIESTLAYIGIPCGAVVPKRTCKSTCTHRRRCESTHTYHRQAGEPWYCKVLVEYTAAVPESTQQRHAVDETVPGGLSDSKASVLPVATRSRHHPSPCVLVRPPCAWSVAGRVGRGRTIDEWYTEAPRFPARCAGQTCPSRRQYARTSQHMAARARRAASDVGGPGAPVDAGS